MRTQPRLVVLAACMAAGLLSFSSSAQAGAPAGRYTVDTNTVFDNETGLMWQRNVDASTYTWINALAYCEGLTLSGYSDWRLPSLKELHTIVDVIAYNPAIDSAAFPSTPAVAFWSSSPVANATAYAWSVNFFDGAAPCNTTSFDYRVRCVR